MSDSPSSPTTRPYRPFPSFTAWSGSTEVSPLVAQFRDRFIELRTQTLDGGIALRERATKWAAVDTGAIEGLYEVDRGFTYSVAANVALLEAVQVAKGESVRRAVEDAVAAYDLVLDLATTREPITEAGIRHLHTVVCRSQTTYRALTAVGWQEQPLPHGEYKAQENHPLNLATNEIHSYASVADTVPEMARLVDELRSDAFLDADPVQQAAYAHYAFVAVHPFADGNGRVARAVASVFLYREPGLPLVVFNDEKPGYFDALSAADDEGYQAFVTFIGDRLIDTVNLLASSEGPELPSAAEQAARMAEGLNGRGGHSHQEVDAAAALLLEALVRHCSKALEELALAPPFSGQVQRESMRSVIPPTGYRTPPNSATVQIGLRSAPPSTASQFEELGVSVARGLVDQVDFIVSSNRGAELSVFLREVLPRVTHALDLRLEEFARRRVLTLLELTTVEARNSLEQSGYR